MNDLELYNECHKRFKYCDGELIRKFSDNNRTKIGDIVGSIHKLTGYRKLKISQKSYQFHRIVFLMHFRHMPKFIDHIDGDKLNNEIENLRIATRPENNRNASLRSDSTSNIKGVRQRSSGKWSARIRFNGKRISLGCFSSKTLAGMAYDKAALSLFGEFAKTNKMMGLI